MFTITADVLIVFPRIDDMDAVVLRGARDLQYILLTIAGNLHLVFTIAGNMHLVIIAGNMHSFYYSR